MDADIAVERIPLGDPRMRDFVRFPWRHYRGHPRWVPQLDADLLGNRLLGIPGLLTPAHPYHRTARAMHFLARRGRRAAGRVSALIHERFDRRVGDRFAFFGFFETIDDPAVAHALLATAADWARGQGARVLRGPGEYANVTHERQGCLVDGFEHDVYVEHTWNPPYYGPLIESFGFRKAMDYHAYRVDLTRPLPDKLARIARGVAARRALRTRALDLSRLAEEIRLVIEIYNQAWSANWGFLPIEDWEADALVKTLRPIVDPGLVRFAFQGDRPVAVLGAFPDPNVGLRPRWGPLGDGDLLRLARLMRMRRRIDRARLMFFGIVPGYRGAGADALLYHQVHQYGIARGYRTSDMSLVLEVNRPMLRAIEGMGGRRTKTWRIYDLEL